MLLGSKDRAELAGREYVSVASVLEGVVILEMAKESEAGAGAGGGASTSADASSGTK